MRILIVAMPDSIHTARWISQIADQGWDIHLFPSIDCGVVHPEIRNLTIHCAIFSRQGHHPSVKVSGIPLFRVVRFWAQKFKYKFFYKDRVAQLKRLITKLNPDIVHTLEIQHAGYLTMEVKDKMLEKFPPWIVTNWGSDIFLFGRLAEHEQKIRAVLHSCDFYSCECKRDVCLAKAYGFSGTVLPVFPNTGGFDMARVSRLRQQGPISTRRLIVLKGYQHWSGRALVGLRALERCADLLAGYELAIYCATPDVVIAAELFSRSTGMPVSIIPFGSPHDEILEYHGKARVSIGLSISDAISTSLLEAMVMGAFPIQSWTACADEWIDNGTTGILVHPEDPDMIELAIRRALTHDDLVNNAAEANSKLAAEKLNMATLKASAIDLYWSAFTKNAKNQGNP
jgi:hypothetical protein